MNIIKTEAPTHSPELLAATEQALKSHNLRLKPGESLVGIIDAVTARGFTLEESHGYLQASQVGTVGINVPVHVNELFEAIATKEPDHFFPREVGGVVCRDQMDTQGKIKFISEFGASAYAKLPQKAAEETVVVLDQTRLTAKQYLSLDRATRADLSGQWGARAIGQILRRK